MDLQISEYLIVADVSVIHISNKIQNFFLSLFVEKSPESFRVFTLVCLAWYLVL